MAKSDYNGTVGTQHVGLVIKGDTMANKKVKVYTYKRVSTSMQVDGYSLDAQNDRMEKYAEFNDMVIAGSYSDEGKSGKNIAGRTDFQRMLNDIAAKKDNVKFVLVFKLSRFGRNAADVLNSLQFMQDYGVNLICIEDGIDSSKESGKLMISVLSAVAEIERENILVQTMEGRRQKAREGRWNGGFAPYGYKLVDGELQIAEDEAEAIRIIFDKFTHTNMGYTGVVKYLAQQGINKKARQNGHLTRFSVSTVKAILDNPVYCGKIAYGRRKTEKIEGTRNEFHIVKQNEFSVYDGKHDAIISEEEFELAKKKRAATAKRLEKKHDLEHEHQLSGIVKCPVCGAGLVGNVNRKKRKDGAYYKEYYFYACKHRLEVDGHRCDYHHQWNEALIDEAVAHVISRLVQNPDFEEKMKEKINMSIDTREADQSLEAAEKQLRQAIGVKDKLIAQLDNLDITDRAYDRKYNDLQERLENAYVKITELEDVVAQYQEEIESIRREKISADNVYNYLILFHDAYDQLPDIWKKKFFQSFIQEIQLYPEQQENGQVLKSMKFKFPVFYNGQTIEEIRWDKENTVDNYFADEYADGMNGVDPSRSELYKLCEQNDVGITCMKPFAGGRLFDAERSPFGVALTPVQCIHYCLNKPGVASVLCGYDTTDQVNAAVAYETAMDVDKDYAGVLAHAPRHSFTGGECTYCGHCRPCPVEIDIAMVNKLYDLAVMQPEVPASLKEHYLALEHRADACIGCRGCESRCPFGVKVADRMEKAAALFR